MKELRTPHGALALPCFMPDATRAVVRTLDTADLEDCGIQCLMINTLHLAASPGANLIASQGGAHAFMNWSGVLASDSGGFQAYSMAARGGKLSGITPEGITYRLGKGKGKKRLTPEKCIQKQLQLGSDILFCLDHCTHPSAPRADQAESVANTVRWARECKDALERLRKTEGPPPLLFAVIQGGAESELRRECADRLLEIGFDGFGFGGWPVTDSGALVDAVHQVAELVPRGVPLHGLGIGNPRSVSDAAGMGYTLFDCVLPTRDARHHRLYVFRSPRVDTADGEFYETVNITRGTFARDGRPLDENCGCLCCRRYSRAYFHHLTQIKDSAADRLATIHNLRFYMDLMAALRNGTAP